MKAIKYICIIIFAVVLFGCASNNNSMTTDRPTDAAYPASDYYESLSNKSTETSIEETTVYISLPTGIIETETVEETTTVDDTTDAPTTTTKKKETKPEQTTVEITEPITTAPIETETDIDETTVIDTEPITSETEIVEPEPNVIHCRMVRDRWHFSGWYWVSRILIEPIDDVKWCDVFDIDMDSMTYYGDWRAAVTIHADNTDYGNTALAFNMNYGIGVPNNIDKIFMAGMFSMSDAAYFGDETNLPITIGFCGQEVECVIDEYRDFFDGEATFYGYIVGTRFVDYCEERYA